MALRVLIVDDEALARSRLRVLLAESGVELTGPVGEAGSATEALGMLAGDPWDVVFLDVRMPGMDGVALASSLRSWPSPPAIVFVTAYAEHALQAFELEAVDYLTKPVRLERLRQALDKVSRWLRQRREGDSQGQDAEAAFLLIHERGRTERIPLEEVVYLKAELKYITVHTPGRAYLYEGSLHDLELRHADLWLRVHRNALVARKRMRALEKSRNTGDAESWVLLLDGAQDPVPVSRRQLSLVREALAGV